MKFTPRALRGITAAPPSKSAAHRALMLAYLAGDAEARPIAYSEDVNATMNCLAALGARVTPAGDTVRIARGALPASAVLDAGESGSAMRFFLPFAPALGVTATINGRGKLPERPYRAFAEELARHGAEFDRREGLPVTVSGRLLSGVYTLPGDVSSQYATGLLLSLPFLKGDSEIVFSSPLESKGYVDLTVAMLADAGVKIEEFSGGYRISGGQSVKKRYFSVEGDYSNAAFFLAAGALSGDVTVSGLDPRSAQGDREILGILMRMGSRIIMFENRIQVKKSALRAIDVDVSGIPDLAPVLSVLMAAAEGTSRIRNAGRLRLKECDRFTATIENLNRAGVNAYAEGDDIVIPGGRLRGGALCGCRDHRMVMSAAVMGTVVPVTVTDGTAVNKTFPDFFDRYRALGGSAEPETDADPEPERIDENAFRNPRPTGS